MGNKVMIVGTGNVGASIAFALINQRTAVHELILTDLDVADAEGEAMDLSDALATAPSFLHIKTRDYTAAKDCQVCIITAGANQKPGETRTELVQKNAKIITSITEQIMQNGFNGIFLIVSNPVDTLTQLVQKVSGLPPERVIGSGTVLDSARLRFELATKLSIHPKSVHAYQVGEHGDTELALWSLANAGSEKITRLFKPTELAEIENNVRNKAYEIINRKGATYYGIGAAIIQILNSILNDERRILSVSNYDDFNNIYYGYPAVVGRAGIHQRLELELSETEGIKLQKSINAVRQTLANINHKD